jgi:hypothetical protein
MQKAQLEAGLFQGLHSAYSVEKLLILVDTGLRKLSI